METLEAARIIKNKIKEKSLRDERTLDFAWGIIEGLHLSKQIDLDQKRELISNFAVLNSNTNESSYLNPLKKRYGRIL